LTKTDEVPFGILNSGHLNLPFDLAQGGELVEPFEIWYLKFVVLSRYRLLNV